MPLSEPAAREALHNRQYDFRGFRREDGLWDIEGRIVDTKTYAFENRHRGRIEPGTPVHDMQVRLTLDDDFRIHDIEAVTDASPFAICPGAAPNYRKLIGVRIAPGWRDLLKRELGGTGGCTHITEMLMAIGTVAFQTIVPMRKRERPGAAGRRPPLLNSCHAFAEDGPVVKDLWPEHWKGGTDAAVSK
ncbi:MAG TPA: DUF2889 domain-containing protein [Kiloniellales bacterium]|nr:DUF2889 domain-containing protein [Kiloniellales bacterium]